MREADIDVRLMDYYLSDLKLISKSAKDADTVEAPSSISDERAEKPAGETQENH